MGDDDHSIWLGEARELLATARVDRDRVEALVRQMCRRAFRDFQFPPSLVVDYLAVSSPGLLEEVGFSDSEIDELMPTVDRVVDEEWAARHAG